MKYIKPNKVTSPQKYVEIIEVLHDGGEESFSIARIRWDGTECFAIRWNVAAPEWEVQDKINEKKFCVGMPSSHGYPVWFVLPEEFNKCAEDFITKEQK